MGALPTGTVTFLFTDIESSSQLWEQYPDGMRTALAIHDKILRFAVESNGGYIVKTTGDGIHAVFKTAANGVAAALAAQLGIMAETWEMIHPDTLRVRMGLHTCEAEVRAGDYYGSAVNRAARLMSIGSGGQILLSNATVEILQEEMPPGITLYDLGEHRLRDLARPEHVYQLAYPGLPSVFPPVRSLENLPNNLPVQMTSFVGREKEVAELTRLLMSVRLITLTGSGGTGKTRLAQEVSAQQMDSFPHGVWMIELAPLADPSQILPTLAQVLGLQESPALSLSTIVVNYLKNKTALLILDNCEHLIDACARLADELLHHCAQIKIIASSREALGIAGEVAYPVPSLQVPEAVQLFSERASAANPKFHCYENNITAVTRICTRLDGIPLAIELAAARAKFLTAEQIAARLDDRFRLLIGGSRTAIPRQQTLRALIDWSYDMLSGEEKRLLRITSVFTGGWTLEALESVANDPSTIEHLEKLVNKSLVVAEDKETAMRYSLLETIRQYAREKLLDAGEREALLIRNRHLDFYLHYVLAVEPKIRGPEALAGLDELEEEQDNIRAALEWAIENNILAALQMSAVLALYWGQRASATEGYTWVQSMLARAETFVPPDGKAEVVFRQARARAVTVRATMALQLGDNHAAEKAIEASVALLRGVNDPKGLAYALALGSTILGFQDKVQRARSWAQEALSISREYGYTYEYAMVAGSDIFLSVVANQPLPKASAEEMIQASRASGNPYLIGLAISNAGRMAMSIGRLEEAYSLLKEAADIFYQMRDRTFYPVCRSELGHLFRKDGRYEQAEEIYRETIIAFQDLGQRAGVAHELECFAFIAIERGSNKRAATLLGAAEKLREIIQSDMTILERPEYGAALLKLRAQMNEAALAEAWAAGRAMPIEQVIRFAIQ